METPRLVTLKGPPELVGQYLYYAINSILYQRGVYPMQSFRHTHQLGMILPVTNDAKAIEFIENVLSQVRIWMSERNVKQVTLIITNVRTSGVVERWDFKVIYVFRPKEGAADSSVTSSLADLEAADLHRSHGEVRAIMEQIGEITSRLPRFNFECTFDIFAYRVPDGGASSDCIIETPALIDSAEVQRAICSSSISDSDPASSSSGHRNT